MSIDWDSEEFRKLYVRTSVDFSKLPIMARCLGTELLRHCDRAGRIIPGTVLDDDLVDRTAYLLRAHEGEHEFLRVGLGKLLSDSADPRNCYLVFRGGYLTIRNLSRAHGSRAGLRRRKSDGEDLFEPSNERPDEREPRETNQTDETGGRRKNATVPSLRSPSGSPSPSDLGSESPDLTVRSGSEDLKASARVSGASEKKPKTSPFKSPGEQEVFEYWAAKLWPLVHKQGHPRANEPRLKRIRSRLKEFTVEQLKQVVDAVMQSPWHLGENPSGKAYIEPDTVFQNEAKVSTWLTHKTPLAKRQASPADQRMAAQMERIKRLQEAGK